MAKRLTVLLGFLMISAGARAEAASADVGHLDLDHRGCCSHHGGVCGCSNDRAKCCDGNLSPTCGCD